ncbi:MAG: hypothetical protein JRI68_30615, partial [Deltaproteobacteria bacterium]|nr:hypothetical protein [Deltaproteobacteria bacterium]
MPNKRPPSDDPPPRQEERKTKKKAGKAGCAPNDLMCAMRAARDVRDKDGTGQNRACHPNDPLCIALDANQQP